MFGMRGIDYRASTLGISLIITMPFANTREAQQGLNRVGRFGDPCKRYIVKGIELVDKKQDQQYRIGLLY